MKIECQMLSQLSGGSYKGKVSSEELTARRKEKHMLRKAFKFWI